MRILYLQTFPLFGSGSGTYARELAKEVAKKHKVAMVVPDSRKIDSVKIYKVNLPVRISFTGHPEWQDSKLYTKVQGKELSVNYLSYFNSVVRAVNEFNPDIVHVHHLMPLSWIARFIKLSYGLNFIVTVHGSELPTLEDDKRYPYFTQEAIVKAKRIVANSFWTKEWMLRILGDEIRKQIRVIPGGVDLSNFPEEMDTEGVEKKFNLKGQKLVLFSGKLTKYKGVRYLIQAARNINATVGIVGDGPERKNLRNLVRELKLKNVRFLGFIDNDDLIKLYYRADICVVPSIWDEPLGLVVLEAMATKTPVVVTRKGGLPLAVKDGVNGLFIRPRNSKEIVEKVNILLSDDKLRKRMGEKARRTILERFTWEKVARKYESIYYKFRKIEDLRKHGDLDKWSNKFLKRIKFLKKK